MTYPSCITSTKASPKMSKHYVHINTLDVINTLADVGFAVASIKTDRPWQRDERFVRHAVDFRLPSTTDKIVDYAPRVVFVNSHNGRTKARALMGIFRFVCSNGLVVGNTFQNEVQRHSGDSARELIDRIRESAKLFKPINKRIDEWRKVELSKAKQMKFARVALNLRFGEKAESYKAEDLLMLRRAEDDRADLWTILNRVQENAMVGGMLGRNANNHQVRSRPLIGIASDVEFNQQLWEVAEEFAG